MPEDKDIKNQNQVPGGDAGMQEDAARPASAESAEGAGQEGMASGTPEAQATPEPEPGTPEAEAGEPEPEAGEPEEQDKKRLPKVPGEPFL